MTFKSITGCILQHMIRLISSHDQKVEQKMTSVFLAILFALENEENIKFLSILPAYFAAENVKCFYPLQKPFVLLLKLIFHRKQGSFVKTRRTWSLYVERKMTILWHMIMSRVAQEPICFELGAMGAFML